MSSSVETNGGDVEKGVGNPIVANDKTQEAAPVVADGGSKKKVNFAKFTNLKTCFNIVKVFVFLLALVALVVMAFQVGRDQNRIQKLNHELEDVSRVKNTNTNELRAAGDISYMDGFSGMIEERENVSLMNRAVMVADATSTVESVVNTTSTVDTCDDETDAPEATHMTSASATFTGPATLTIVQTSTNTISSTATVSRITSVDALSVSLTSMTATSSTTQFTTVTYSTSTETCGEWGDGAGPCDRPYGAPNTPPVSTSSALSAMAITVSSTPSAVVVSLTPIVPVMTSQSSMAMSAAGFSATTSVDAVTVSAAAVESSTTSSSTSSSLVFADPFGACAPTATLFVTITASAVEDAPSMTGASNNRSITPSTTTITSTSRVTTLTQTLSGTAVTTEALTLGGGGGGNTSTLAWANGTGTAPTFTLSHVTVTFTTAHPGGNATYTGGPAAGASTVPVMSGGEKALGRPMGATGGSSSGTGNGVYCVVMLVSLVALLI